MTGLEIKLTEDGSPTAYFTGDSEERGETMHSLKGALSETLYIYGSPQELVRTQLTKPHLFSLGLGLGYFEIISSALSIKYSQPLLGVTYEISEDLRNGFFNWLKSSSEPTELGPVYQTILALVSQKFNFSEEQIYLNLKNSIKEGDWQLYKELTASTPILQKSNIIAFDAFSSKSSPELWNREFLDYFLKNAAAEQCLFSTYACTGHLKRALKDAEFELHIREGFASKRDSTLALRGLQFSNL